MKKEELIGLSSEIPKGKERAAKKRANKVCAKMAEGIVGRSDVDIDVKQFVDNYFYVEITEEEKETGHITPSASLPPGIEPGKHRFKWGFVGGGKKGYYTLKITNVKIDFKIVMAVIDLGKDLIYAASTEDWSKVVKPAVSLIEDIYKAAKIPLSKEEAAVAFWLYRNKKYYVDCEEAEVIAGVKELLIDEGAEPFSDKKIMEIIESLAEKKVILLDDGKVRLVEKVRIDRLIL